MKKSVRFNFRMYFTQFFMISLALLIALSLGLVGKGYGFSVKTKSDTAAVPDIKMSLKEEIKIAEEVLDPISENVMYTPMVMKFINMEGEIVYEAKGVEIWEISDKVLEEFFYKSDYLMEVGNEHYYLVK